MHIIFNNTNISDDLYSVITYKKNDIVFLEGDECTKVGFIIEGVITIKTITYTNNEYEINHLVQNQMFGEFLLFSDSNHYLGTGIASRNTKVVYFTKKNLLLAFKDNDFLKNYLVLLSNISLKIQQKVKVLSQVSISEKILFLLYENYKRTNSKVLQIKSKQMLADFLCIPRPSLSRELINLQNKGTITFDRYSITLNHIVNHIN